MTPEQRVAVVTDSGCSIRPEFKEAKIGVTIVPLEIRFFEKVIKKGQETLQYVPYKDLEISIEDFYQRMRASLKKYGKLPQTSGAVPGRIAEIYKRLSKRTNSIISIHLTKKHSVAWESAVLGAKMALEEIPELLIEVIDSKQITLGMWFLTEHAVKLAKRGANLEQIKTETLEMIPKIHLLAVLENFENLKRGGRADRLVKAYLASFLSIYPVIGLKDGELKFFERTRSPKKARKRMIEMVGDSGKLVRMAILHTNSPELAKEVREKLGRLYKGRISIYDAGPVLGVHAGEGAVGVVFQKA